MSWVEKTSGDRFRGVYRDAAGHRHSKVFARKAEAKLWLAAADTDRARGLRQERPGAAVAVLLIVVAVEQAPRTDPMQPSA